MAFGNFECLLCTATLNNGIVGLLPVVTRLVKTMNVEYLSHYHISHGSNT